MHEFDIMTMTSRMLNKMNDAYDRNKGIYGLPSVPDIILDAVELCICTGKDAFIDPEADVDITIEKCDMYYYSEADEFVLYVASCTGLKVPIITPIVRTINDKTVDTLICVFPRDIFALGSFGMNEVSKILFTAYNIIRYNETNQTIMNSPNVEYSPYAMISFAVTAWCVNNNISKWWMSTETIDGKPDFAEIMSKVLDPEAGLNMSDNNYYAKNVLIPFAEAIATTFSEDDIKDYHKILNKFVSILMKKS